MTLRIRHKVILPALAIIVVLLVPAGYSMRSILKVNRFASTLKEYALPGSRTVRDMRVQLQEVILFAGLAAGEPETEFAKEYAEKRADLDRSLASLARLEGGVTHRTHWRLTLALEEIDTAVRSGSLDTVRAAGETALDRLSKIEMHYVKETEETVKNIATFGQVATQFTLYGLVVGLVVSLVVWTAILMSLGKPLRELVDGTQRIAEGRFDEPIPVLAEDELGTLSEAFNRMAKSLSELDRMKAEFVATASHELKTPLACIKGFAGLLRTGSSGPLTGEQRRTLLQIEEQVDQMNRFVTELLDLSRLRAGRMTMKIRSLPAAAFFSTSARSFEGMAKKKGIRFKIEISERMPERIDADPDRLGEVIYNLLGNAFKFTPAGGEVLFEVEGDPEWIRGAVSDTGPGIAQEDLPFVFEKYYKGAGAGPERKREGAGLGLAISRGIVEKHGGRIWVERREGPGTRFVFRIPRSAPQESDDPGTVKPEEDEGRSRWRIARA